MIIAIARSEQGVAGFVLGDLMRNASCGNA